ncbi:MAG: protein kinase [Kofleriaceae bacterium]
MSESGDATAGNAELAPGQQVGEYVVDAKIGEGGFGSVFRATHPVIGKIAAIKVLAPKYSADPDMLSRFASEAKAVNQIRHRNIIDIFAFGTLPDGRSYYVMEFLEGESLADHLERVGAMPLEEALPVLEALARALDAAHAKGIAHRDLKPDNVLLARDPDGEPFPKLLDFGIAKLLGGDGGGAMHKTRTGAPIGTPYYMSPEQSRGRDVDHRTDIYAFGVMTYQLLTGTVPFDGDDYMDILMKQIGEEPVPPSRRRPDLPPGIDEAVAWMMRKDPAARPPDLASAMAALTEAAQAAGLRLPMSTRVERRSGVVGTPRTPVGVPPLTPDLRRAGTAPTVALGGAELPIEPLAPAAPRTGRWRWAAGGVALIALAGIVVVATRPSTPAPTRPAAVAVVAPPDAAPRRLPDARPRLVTLTFTGLPAGAEAHGPGGTLLGVAPTIQLPVGQAPLVITLTAEGHAPSSITVTPDRDQAHEVILTVKPAVEPPPTKPERPRPRPDDKPKCPGSPGCKPTDRNSLPDPFAR